MYLFNTILSILIGDYFTKIDGLMHVNPSIFILLLSVEFLFKVIYKYAGGERCQKKRAGKNMLKAIDYYKYYNNAFYISFPLYNKPNTTLVK